MVKFNVTKKHSALVQALVSKLTLKQRKEFSAELVELQKVFGWKEDLFYDRRGKHWATKRVATPQLLVEIFGHGFEEMTYEEASQSLGKSVQKIRYALTVGNGIAGFRVGDDIYTVKRMPKLVEQ